LGRQKKDPVGSNKAPHQTQIDTRYQLMLSGLVCLFLWEVTFWYAPYIQTTFV
jgi:hypothetical protein